MKLRASAESGKANKAVIELIAKNLDLPKKSVCILSGKTSSHKIVEISGLTESEVKNKLK